MVMQVLLDLVIPAVVQEVVVRVEIDLEGILGR